MLITVFRTDKGDLVAAIHYDGPRVPQARMEAIYEGRVINEITINNGGNDRAVEALKSISALSDEFADGLEDIVARIATHFSSIEVVAKVHGIPLEQLSSLVTTSTS